MILKEGFCEVVQVLELIVGRDIVKVIQGGYSFVPQSEFDSEEEVRQFDYQPFISKRSLFPGVIVTYLSKLEKSNTRVPVQ